VTARPPIRVTVDHIVLHGVDRADSAAVQRALAAELRTALAGVDGLAPAAQSDLRLSVAGSSDPTTLGRSAGGAIGSALASGRRRG
jgi:hypothetical protein